MSVFIACPRCGQVCGNIVDEERRTAIHCQYCGYEYQGDSRAQQAPKAQARMLDEVSVERHREADLLRERARELDALEAAIAECTAAEGEAATAHQAVYGDGGSDAGERDGSAESSRDQRDHQAVLQAEVTAHAREVWEQADRAKTAKLSSGWSSSEDAAVAIIAAALLPATREGETYTAPTGGWTCFHCGETFTTTGSAADHFGALPGCQAGCVIDRVALEEGGKPERGRGLLMALRKAESKLAAAEAKADAALAQYDDWLPTAENINALPEPLRHLIHQLETRMCDPAGDTRMLIILREQNAQLLAKAESIDRHLGMALAAGIRIQAKADAARVQHEQAEAEVLRYHAREDQWRVEKAKLQAQAPETQPLPPKVTANARAVWGRMEKAAEAVLDAAEGKEGPSPEAFQRAKEARLRELAAALLAATREAREQAQHVVEEHRTNRDTFRCGRDKWRQRAEAAEAKADGCKKECDALAIENVRLSDALTAMGHRAVSAEAKADEAERTVRSLATMLGLGNVPPRDTLERDLNALKAKADAALKEAGRQFQIQLQRGAVAHPLRIPWSVAEKAYSVYAAEYGKGQSLERIAARGGFTPSEMDTFLPVWRDEASEITRLKSEADAARREQRELLKVLESIVNHNKPDETHRERVTALKRIARNAFARQGCACQCCTHNEGSDCACDCHATGACAALEAATQGEPNLPSS